MFIIPAAGMAKAMMVVTISLHPGAHQGPASYTVQPGDSLSAIAAHAYSNAADWLGYGGGQYASSANQATAAQQVAVAQRVLAGQGIGAWPVCRAGG